MVQFFDVFDSNLLGSWRFESVCVLWKRYRKKCLWNTIIILGYFLSGRYGLKIFVSRLYCLNLIYLSFRYLMQL